MRNIFKITAKIQNTTLYSGLDTSLHILLLFTIFPHFWKSAESAQFYIHIYQGQKKLFKTKKKKCSKKMIQNRMERPRKIIFISLYRFSSYKK